MMQLHKNVLSAMALVALAACADADGGTRAQVDATNAPAALTVYSAAGSDAPTPALAAEHTWVDVGSSGTGADEVKLQVAERAGSGDPLIIQITGSSVTEQDQYEVFIDVDLDPGTGVQQAHWTEMGADYLILNGVLYPANEEQTWADSSKPKTAKPRPVEGGIQFEIPVDDMPGLQPDLHLGLGVLRTAPSKLLLPPARFWRSPPTWVGGGMIVPAYLPLMNTTAWDALAAQAELVKEATSTRKDFWVVLNGANGPYEAAPDAKTMEHIQQIKTNEGKLFGYVHACNTQYDKVEKKFICFSLRDFKSEIEPEIDTWFKQFPMLDGIWIDEYYPDHEIGGNLIGSQYDPFSPAASDAQSRFVQLTSYIRQGRPGVKIIGNAGGHLKSDRLKYAGLVDVLCSIEVSGEELAPGRTGPLSSAVSRQPIKTTYGQLALLHSVSSETSAVDAVHRALSEGYSHVFVGDGRTSDDTAWRTVPTYLAAEVLAVLQ